MCILFNLQHLSSLKISTLLKTGRLYQGTLSISNHNYLAGSIFATITTGPDADSQETSILISGRENINRAIHGDVVAVELLPKAEWVRMGDDRVLDQESDDDEQVEEDDASMDLDQLDENISVSDSVGSSPLRPTGRIVGVIKRNWRPYCVSAYYNSHFRVQSKSRN